MQPILPSWSPIATPSNLRLPYKFRVYYNLAVLILLGCICWFAWNCFVIHNHNENITVLRDRLASEQKNSAYIVSENNRLNNVQKKFDSLYPYISHRYSFSQILSALGSNQSLPRNAYFGKIVLNSNNAGDLDITVSMVSQSSLIAQASQSMDTFRQNVSELLNTVHDKMILSEYSLQSYSALGEPVTRTGEYGGFEIAEAWKYNVKQLSMPETTRLYEIISTTYPLNKEKK